MYSCNYKPSGDNDCVQNLVDQRAEESSLNLAHNSPVLENSFEICQDEFWKVHWGTKRSSFGHLIADSMSDVDNHQQLFSELKDSPLVLEDDNSHGLNPICNNSTEFQSEKQMTDKKDSHCTNSEFSSQMQTKDRLLSYQECSDAIEELSEITPSFFNFHEEKSSIPDPSENEFINLSHPFLSCQSPINLAALNIESEPSKHLSPIVWDLESTPKTNNCIELRSRHRAKISHTADFKVESPNKRSCTSPSKLNFQLNQEKSSLKKRSSFRRKKARA